MPEAFKVIQIQAEYACKHSRLEPKLYDLIIRINLTLNQDQVQKALSKIMAVYSALKMWYLAVKFLNQTSKDGLKFGDQIVMYKLQ